MVPWISCTVLLPCTQPIKVVNPYPKTRREYSNIILETPSALRSVHLLSASYRHRQCPWSVDRTLLSIATFDLLEASAFQEGHVGNKRKNSREKACLPALCRSLNVHVDREQQQQPTPPRTRIK